MSFKTIFFCCISILITFYIETQTKETIVGAHVYESIVNGETILKRTLILYANNTFEFENYRYIKQERPKQEKYKYGKGSWKLENNKVILYTSAEDITGKFVLNFTNTKARYVTKPLRDKSNKDIKNTFNFIPKRYFLVKAC